MVEPSPPPTPGRLTRRLTANIAADALRHGVSQRTLLLAVHAQVGERDFLLSLQADRSITRKQAARLRRLVLQFPLDAATGAARPHAVVPFAWPFMSPVQSLPWRLFAPSSSLFSMPPVSAPPASASTVELSKV